MTSPSSAGLDLPDSALFPRAVSRPIIRGGARSQVHPSAFLDSPQAWLDRERCSVSWWSTVTRQCTHLDHLKPVDNLSTGCEECLAAGHLDWVHLRVCQECGHVGCCDQSPGRHATEHFHRTSHPLIRSYEPGEDWYWCFVDELVFALDGSPPAPSHP